MILIEAADADFQVLVQLVAVVGFRQHVDIQEVHGNRKRPIMPHGANQLAVAEGMIAGEVDLPDFYLRSLFHLEGEDHGVAGRDALVLR